MTIGERIKFLRLQRGLSQRQLAIKAGVGLSSINRYEARDSEPHIRTAIQISRALGVSVEQLAGVATACQSKELCELRKENQRLKNALIAARSRALDSCEIMRRELFPGDDDY